MHKFNDFNVYEIWSATVRFKQCIHAFITSGNMANSLSCLHLISGILEVCTCPCIICMYNRLWNIQEESRREGRACDVGSSVKPCDGNILCPTMIEYSVSKSDIACFSFLEKAGLNCIEIYKRPKKKRKYLIWLIDCKLVTSTVRGGFISQGF